MKLEKKNVETAIKNSTHTTYTARTTCTRCAIKVGSLFFFPLSKGHNSFIHKQSLPHQALTSGKGEKEKKEKEREVERG